MECIDAFGSYDDSQICVTLKDGIDLRSLARDQEVEFEVDDSAAPSIDDRPFNREDVYKNTNYKCTITDDDQLSPFEQLRRGMQDISGDGGVLKKVVTQGVGAEVPEGAIVRVHYNGYLEYSDEPYDSSRLRDKHQRFRLGEGGVLPGWEVAVKSMKKSEKAEFLLSPKYAFGRMGCPPRIPPDASILFEIELVSFIDPKSSDDNDELPPDQRKETLFTDLLTKASAMKEDGNAYYEAGMLNDAAMKYKNALRRLEDIRLKDEAEEDQWKAILLKLYLNLALCSHKQRKPKLVITNCRKALEFDPNNVKAFFRLGQAYMQLGEFRKSRDYFLKASKLQPGNMDILQEMQQLNRAEKQFNALQQSGTEAKVSVPPINKSLEEKKAFFIQKLSDFKGNHKMAELVLPAPLSEDDVTCVVEVAPTFDLSTEMLSNHSLRIYKPEAVVPDQFL